MRAMDAVLIVIGLVAAGLVMEAYAATTAPLGYQDESGFHFGLPHAQDQSADRAEMGNPS